VQHVHCWVHENHDGFKSRDSSHTLLEALALHHHNFSRFEIANGNSMVEGFNNSGNRPY
jgi:hypothetical protein